MMYARIQNNALVEYPLFEGDLKLRFPNVSFTDPFTPPEGYVEVEDVPYPQITYKQNVNEGAPKLVNSKWTRVWIVSDASADEITERTAKRASDLSKISDSLLNSSNWTQLEDSPLSESTRLLWASYRKALRDLPSQPGFPWEITWPVAPSS